MVRCILYGLVALLCVAQACAAATYYVDTTGGDNARSCATAQNVATPRATINAGRLCLTAGDTLAIRGGTYAEFLHTRSSAACPTCGPIPSGTSFATATTITNYNGETVRLRPPSTSGSLFVVRFWSGDTSHHIIIKGTPANTFIVDGVPFSCAAGQLLAYGGVGLYGPNHHIRLDGVLVTDTCGNGGIQTFHETALSGLASHSNEFINGTVRRAGSKHPNGQGGAGSAFGHCIYISTHSNLIENNVLEDCAGNGVSIYRPTSAGLNTGNNIVRRNTITRNGSCRTLTNPACASQNNDDGMIFVAGDNNQVYNNVLHNGKNGGITVRYNDPDGNLIANNSICSITPQLSGGAARGIRIDPGASTTTVRNNVVFQVATPLLDESSSTIGGPNNWISGDPLYRVPCTDLHLTAASSATVRQGGTDLSSTFTTDKGLLPRTPPWSMGAYEFGQISAPFVLSFTVPPVGAVEGTTLPLIRVEIRDTGGVLQTGHAASCDLAVASGPGTLSGTTSVSPSSGVCTWSTLSINQEGPYTVQVTSSGVTSVTSGSFVITDAVAPPPVVAQRHRTVPR